MVARLGNPNAPVDSAARAKSEGVASGPPADEDHHRLDPLHTDLAPELNGTAGQSDPPRTTIDHDPVETPSAAMRLPLGGGAAKNLDPGKNAFGGRFGLGEEALSRLEAGLRAQRHQLGARPAQPTPVATPGDKAYQEGDTHPPDEHFRRLRRLLLILIPIVMTMLVAYTFVKERVVPVPQHDPVSDAVEPVPIPEPPPPVETGHEENGQSNTNPTPPQKIEVEPPPAMPIKPETSNQLTAPVSNQITAPVDVPARAPPPSGASPQHPDRAHRTHPAQQPKGSGPVSRPQIRP
jgi:hypothetical protein